ncbi:MAG: OmpH family outer membrane protein [Pseudomonadota bacterium]
MKTLLVTAALAASFLAPAAAQAQAIPGAIVAVVDLERVSTDCNACKTAAATLRSQATAQENREKALITPLQAEEKAIRDAAAALNGKEPDAGLQARAKAFQTKYESAQAESAKGRAQLQANATYVQKQIRDKLNPIYQSVMVKRGANLLVEVGTTLATAQSLDVTADVLAGLNASLPSLSVNAPAPAASTTTKPQGR